MTREHRRLHHLKRANDLWDEFERMMHDETSPMPVGQQGRLFAKHQAAQRRADRLYGRRLARYGSEPLGWGWLS